MPLLLNQQQKMFEAQQVGSHITNHNGTKKLQPNIHVRTPYSKLFERETHFPFFPHKTTKYASICSP